MSVQSRVDNVAIPFIRSGGSYIKDAITFLQDAGRSTILYKYTVMAISQFTVATSATVVGTGNGLCTAIARIAGPSLIPGSYNLEVITKVANGGVFKLEDPNGALIATGLAITAGATSATVFNIGGLTFTITDGSTDFEVGDAFAIVVTAVNKWVPLDPAALDGSEIFAGIFMGDNITAAALVAGDVEDNPVLVGGACTIDTEQLIFENSATLATLQSNGKTIEQSMAEYGIFAESTVDIDSYEN